MKKIHFLAMCAPVMAALITMTATTSCKGNQTNNFEDIDSLKNAPSADKVNSLAEYSMSDTVTVNGTRYNYSFTFHSDKNLPTVINAVGYKYYDNVVDLVITKGGTEVYKHTFSKESLKDKIPTDGGYSDFVLQGFNFNYLKINDHSKFHFIASVGECDEACEICYYVAIDISEAGVINLTPVSDDVETGSQLPGLNIDPDEEDGV